MPTRYSCLISRYRCGKEAVLCCSFQLGLWPGMALSAVDAVLLRGNAPWTLHHRCVSLAVGILGTLDMFGSHIPPAKALLK